MLNPALRAPDAVERLRARWARTGSLRVDGLLDDAAARELLEAVRREPHAVTVPSPDDAATIAFQYWKWVGRPEPACEHTLCRFGRALQGEVLAWVERVTGLELAPGPDGLVASTLFTKGSYLDAHDDWGRGRAVAYVVGLTPRGEGEACLAPTEEEGGEEEGRRRVSRDAPWPADEGGWLEFLAAPDGEVLERRPPGWNTLDLFDVRAPGRWHRVSILREHRERRAVAGWFHPRG